MDLDAYLDGLDERDWLDDPPDGRLRLAVIGLGGFARDYALPAVEAADFCAVTVLVSGSADKAAAVADAVDADRGITYDAFHDGTAADAYDGVYIVTPNARHLEFAETAATLGKHVICEKPLEASVDRSRRLVEACEDAGVTLMTAYRMQTHPAVRRVRELIDDGFVGEPVLASGNFSGHSMRGDRGPDHWRYDPDLAGGGALMDIGVYPLNTARFLLGAEPTAVSAVTATPDEAYAGVDEHVGVQAEFPGGTIGSFTASFDAQGDSRIGIVGSDGAVSIERAFPVGTERELTLVRGDAEFHVTVPALSELTEEFDYFAHRALTGRRPEPDGRDGLRDVEIMMGAYEAAERGTRVSVE